MNCNGSSSNATHIYKYRENQSSFYFSKKIIQYILANIQQFHLYILEKNIFVPGKYPCFQTCTNLKWTAAKKRRKNLSIIKVINRSVLLFLSLAIFLPQTINKKMILCWNYIAYDASNKDFTCHPIELTYKAIFVHP